MALGDFAALSFASVRKLPMGQLTRNHFLRNFQGFAPKKNFKVTAVFGRAFPVG